MWKSHLLAGLLIRVLLLKQPDLPFQQMSPLLHVPEKPLGQLPFAGEAALPAAWFQRTTLVGSLWIFSWTRSPT